MPRFRILSLDGGGVRGAYSAAVLKTIEERLQRENKGEIIDYFDLITGTSTGGILAIGLGLGLTASKLLQFYCDKADDIFSSTGLQSSWFATFNQLYRTKYDSSKLRHTLASEIENKPLGASKRPLVINSYNATRGGAHLFKTCHHEDHDRHYRMSAVDIAMATAAAPLYFRAVDLPLGDDHMEQTFLDGGVWANCPVLVGIAEAIKYFNANLEDIHVLSIGTTYKAPDIKENQKRGGAFQWGLDLFTLLMSAQQAGAIGTAKVMLKTPLARITNQQKEDIPLDDNKKVPELAELGRADALRELDRIFPRFFDQPAPPFTPLHSVE